MGSLSFVCSLASVWPGFELRVSSTVCVCVCVYAKAISTGSPMGAAAFKPAEANESNLVHIHDAHLIRLLGSHGNATPSDRPIESARRT